MNILYQLGIVLNNGKGIFYKAVKKDFTDFYSGKHSYKKHKSFKMNLKRDQDKECGEGFHFTNYQNAVAFGKEQREGFKIISAEIHLKDILAIHQKVRVKAYANAQEVTLK
jgi:hypothetical protein